MDHCRISEGLLFILSLNIDTRLDSVPYVVLGTVMFVKIRAKADSLTRSLERVQCVMLHAPNVKRRRVNDLVRAFLDANN